MNIYIVQIDCKIVCPVFIHLLKSYSRLFHTIFILLITLRVIVKLEIKAFKNTCFHCSHCPQQGCSSRYNRFHNSVLLLRGGFISVNVQYPSSVKKKGIHMLSMVCDQFIQGNMMLMKVQKLNNFWGKVFRQN